MWKKGRKGLNIYFTLVSRMNPVRCGKYFTAGEPRDSECWQHIKYVVFSLPLVLSVQNTILFFFVYVNRLRRRRLALPLLPDGDPNLIVRVLEAFMALQFQAGVLTEEIVLAVQGLVEVRLGANGLFFEHYDSGCGVRTARPVRCLALLCGCGSASGKRMPVT